MTPSQCRAARALLRWSQQGTDEMAGVPKNAVRNFERGYAVTTIENLGLIKYALEAFGVVFSNNSGVALRPNHGLNYPGWVK